MGEMVFARYLLKGDAHERARLRRAANERTFGVQIATNNVDEGVQAARLALDAGSDFIDLNCGCPIHEATRRGLGSAMLRHPDKLARLVQGIADGSPLPLSVKVRIASEGGLVNVREVVGKLRDAGAAAVTIHGRTAEARYSKAADWQLIAQCVSDNAAAGSAMPIVGNGDILTHWEARRQMDKSGVDAVMVGRGALTKPWIFDEFAHGRAWEPTAVERVEIYRRLVAYMKEHFGDDERGRKKSWYFLPWHFDFLTRYRALPEAEFGQLETPLMQTRMSPLTDDDVPPLERLLAHTSPSAHELIARRLWEAASDAEAVRALTELARSDELVEAVASEPLSEMRTRSQAAVGDATELTNVPDSKGGAKPGRKQRRRRQPPPQRTEAEIAALRAERAAKRALTGAPPHVDGGRRNYHKAT